MAEVRNTDRIAFDDPTTAIVSDLRITMQVLTAVMFLTSFLRVSFPNIDLSIDCLDLTFFVVFFSHSMQIPE
jgi:hypothetical protein